MKITLSILLVLALAVALAESKRGKYGLGKVIFGDDEKKCMKRLRLSQNELYTAIEIRQMHARSGGTIIRSMADMEKVIDTLLPSPRAANRMKSKMPRLIECELKEFRPIMWGRTQA